MGTWGADILEDDLVADIVWSATDRLKRGSALHQAVSDVIKEFSEVEDDEDEGPLLWLAVAHLQWTYGSVEAHVLDRVRDDIEQENGLERWREDAGALTERKAALARFLAQIEQPNPAPSPLPTGKVRKAPFQKGDCLSVRLPDGKYTACLVLRVDNSDPENGMNLVAGLDYYEAEPPTVSVFSARNWLRKTWGEWNNERDICWYWPVGFAEIRNRITVVDKIRIRWTDPRKCHSYTSWENVGSFVVYSRSEPNDEG